MNSGSASDAYQSRLGQVRAHLTRIEALAAAHEREAGDRPDWGHTGDMGHVAEILEQAVQFLGGEESPPLPVPALKPGDRIRLILMPNDPAPIKPGSLGTVVAVTTGNLAQIEVTWDDDNDRSLALVPGVDQFEIVS